MSVTLVDLKFMGYPMVRDVLRDEFRQRRSTKRTCSCGRQLNHLETNWLAVRTPEGTHLTDHVCCSWCLAQDADILRKKLENPLTTLEYDTILVLLIRGTELFI